MKKNQKIKSAERLLAHKATALRPVKTWAANSCPASPRSTQPSANICYALQPHRPTLFYLLSPEAYLLTQNHKNHGNQSIL
ncbi:hypothetical protein [Mucilaginibacter sp.]